MTLQEYLGFILSIDKINNIARYKKIAQLALENDSINIEDLTQEELDELYNRGLQILKFNERGFDDVFTHNGTEYRVRKIEDLRTEEWLTMESVLEKNPGFNSYAAVIAILVGADSVADFVTLDHKIAMPIVSFFLRVYRSLDADIRQFMKIQEKVNLLDLFTPEFKQDLINFMDLGINLLCLPQTTEPTSLI